jgi:prepilin-type N-terminal cleavage/methylation domain-containing protein
MKARSRNCSRSSTRAGLTLLEVVAAIAILGTVLAGMVLARSHHARQIARAQRLENAVRVADELLSGWWTRPQGIPIAESGSVDGNASLSWQTRLVADLAIGTLGARVVRIEVRDLDMAASSQRSEEMACVVVDIVLPPPARAAEVDDAARAEPGRTAQASSAPGTAGPPTQSVQESTP